MQTTKIVLTDHAIERILSREKEEGVIGLTMTPDEVLTFLQQGIYVETTQHPIPGKRWNPRTTYWVFYSPADSGFFVAIGMKPRASQEHAIFTVIPANKKGKWMLDSALLGRAKSLACHQIGFVPLQFKNETDLVNQPAMNFHVSCMYLQDGGKQKVKKLFSTPSVQYEGQADRLIATEGFLGKCIEAAATNGISKDNLVHILVRLGTHAQPIVLDVA